MPVGVLEEISKISQNLQGRALAGVLLLWSCSLQIASKEAKVKITQSTLSKKRLLHRDSYKSTFCKFWKKKYEHDF